MDISNGIMFADPVDMLIYLDDDLLKGHYSLYPWQIKIMKDFAADSTGDDPYQAVVRAANGSGKDKMIIAPCVTWMCMRYPDATGVVTSASGTQLDRQTNTYIEKIAKAANTKIHPDLWKINYRHYEVNFPKQEGADERKSTIELFVTDESGRAEGWHPKTFNSHLGIFTSEAKSIPDEIFNALARCTGFTKRIDVSTPGLPMGHFFNRCTGPGWTKYHITAYECPHVSRKYIEQCKLDYGGEGSSLFKSMVLAEFGSTDEMVVIPYHHVWRAIFESKVEWYREDFNTAGLDLSAGGDETVLVVRNGNKVIGVYGFRFDDTTKTVDYLERLFKENSLNNPKSRIFGDAGGLGKPILDELKNRRKWHNIRYVLNNSAPNDGRAYYNRGAEYWFHVAKLFEMGEAIIPNDERLKRQLSTRYYKQSDGNKILLENKLQARAKGHPSPDRADAMVLAFCGYKSKLEDDRVAQAHELPMPAKVRPVISETGDLTMRGNAKRASEMVVDKLDREIKYYDGKDSPGSQRRKNMDEMQRLIQEHNVRIRELKKINEEQVVS